MYCFFLIGKFTVHTLGVKAFYLGGGWQMWLYNGHVILFTSLEPPGNLLPPYFRKSTLISSALFACRNKLHAYYMNSK